MAPSPAMGERVIRRCPVCRAIFKADASRLKHGRGVHCSRACQYKANRSKLRKPVLSICIGCRVTFERSPSQLRNRKGAGKYCTRACRDKYWAGKLTPNWQGGDGVDTRGPHWQRIRRYIRKRDGCCQSCGATGELHVHHVIPFRMFEHHEAANDEDNLVSLCPPCHRRADAMHKWVRLPNGAGLLRFASGGVAWEMAREKGMHVSGQDAPLFAGAAT